MRMLAVYTAPVWDDQGQVHICSPGEVRPGLADHVIGWANVMVLDIKGEQHTLLYTGVE